MPFDFVMSRALIKDAYDHGMTVSAFLERLDPSTKYPVQEQGMDAFERQLMRYDIRTATDWESGMPCHSVGRFFEDDDQGGRDERAALFPEFISRQYRKLTRVHPRNGVNFGLDGQRGMKMLPREGARFPTADTIPSFSLYPAATPFEFRYQQLVPSALNVLIARTRPVAAGDFRALYLTDSTATVAARMGRVAEYAEIPAVRFDTSESAIALKKYGRRIDLSYEAVRRMAIDMLSWAIMYVAAKADADKEATVLDILINGDGNSGTSATSTSGSTLDSAAAGKLTLKMWTAFRFLWGRPYASNVVAGTSSALTDLLLLQAASANIAPLAISEKNVPGLAVVKLFRNTFDNMVAVDNSGVTANNLLAIDANWTAEMVSEVGADIVQSDMIISAQFNQIVISETIGFDIATKGQNRLLAYTI